MSRSDGFVPVTMGSARTTTAEVDGFRIIDAWFPPGSHLPPHVHDRANFGVMLEGSFKLRPKVVPGGRSGWLLTSTKPPILTRVPPSWISMQAARITRRKALPRNS